MIASLTFDTRGTGRGLYTEAIDLHRLGLLHIERATSIEFDNDIQRWRVRDTKGFPMFNANTRQECLEWERMHLDSQEDRKHELQHGAGAAAVGT